MHSIPPSTNMYCTIPQNKIKSEPFVVPLQLGHWGVGDLQRLLWSDRVAAALGELQTTGKLGTAATICSQQTMWQGSSRGKTNLQSLPVPSLMEKRALDPGTTSQRDDSLLNCRLASPLKWFDYVHLSCLDYNSFQHTVSCSSYHHCGIPQIVLSLFTFTISTFTLYLICPNSRCFIFITLALSLD